MNPHGGGPGHVLLGAAVAALEFFTRIPRPGCIPYDPAHARLAPALAPAVGWLIGGMVGGVLVLAALVLPPTTAAVLAVVAGVVLTGALHEDGLADVCDATGAGGDRERALAIMKDSRIGAYGALAVVLSMLARVSLLASLIPVMSSAALVLGVVVLHAHSRAAGLWLSQTLPYARPGGQAKAADFVHRLPAAGIAAGIATGLAPVLLLAHLTRPEVLFTTFAVALVALMLRRDFLRRFGGWTGDCVGAAQQLTELAALATLVVTLVPAR